MDPTQQGTSPYASILDSAPPPAAQPMQYGPMVNPAPADPTVAAMNKPAQSPQELEQRKAGWMQIFQNPNFMRALGFAGAQLAQPVQPGQTQFGHLGQAFATGLSAYQAGDYAQQQADLAKSKDARENAESAATVANTEARTGEAVARTPGIQAESDVGAATVNDKIARIKSEADAAALKLKEAKGEADVAAVERELRMKRAQIEKEVPDEKLRAAALAEMDTKILAASEARARLGLTEAQTKGAKASAVAKEITVDTLNKMDDKERKEFLTKSGRYSVHTSGISQQAEMWGQIYDKLPANDPSKTGKTREQFQMDRLSSSKSKDAADTLTKYLQAGGDDPDVISGLTDLVKAGISAKKGVPAPGAPSAPAAGEKPKITDKAGYDALKSGQRYIDPRGIERIKK